MAVAASVGPVDMAAAMSRGCGGPSDHSHALPKIVGVSCCRGRVSPTRDGLTILGCLSFTRSRQHNVVRPGP